MKPPFKELRKIIDTKEEREETIDHIMIEYSPEAVAMVLSHTIKTLYLKIERAMKAYDDNNL